MLHSLFSLYLLLSSAQAAWPPCKDVNQRENPPGSGLCEPAFTDPKQILIPFKPQIHDTTPTSSQVIDRSSETFDTSGQHVVDTIAAPSIYARKIYACVPPLSVNTSSLKCEFKRENHACNAGDGVQGTFASEVSGNIGGATTADRFQNAVNKKLNCCLNEFGSSASVSSPIKFDCIDNSKGGYSDFNALWASSDDELDGGQTNAFVLTNPMGKPLTGFFTLDGTRCAEFNEFAGSIQPGRIKGETFTAVGNPIQQSTSSGFHYLQERYLNQGMKVPSTNAERKRCPVLVRAATVLKCPSNPMLPAAQKTYEMTDASGSVIQKRCSVASSIQVNVRVEQVFEIEGMPKMATEDTVTDAKNASVISIDRIIANKYGNACPPGTTRQGDVCVY